VIDKSGAGAGFLRELRFPLPIYIPSASPKLSSISPEAGTIGQEWPQCHYPHIPKKKMRTKFWQENLKEIDLLEDIGVESSVVLNGS
jgi:hypothetical protein